MSGWDLRHGRYQDALASVTEVDAVICDPPYSKRTHSGHHAGAELANRKQVLHLAGVKGYHKRKNGGLDALQPRRSISYDHWDALDVQAFVEFWAPRNRGWFVVLSDSDLCHVWRAAFEREGLTGFQPLPILIPGMTVRMSGDGPSSWAIYVNVARPKALAKWGTLPGGYTGPQGEREHIGGKPLWAMRALVRDYTKPGDLVCDPCAGAATTLIAAIENERRAIGAEVCKETYEAGRARLLRGHTPDLFPGIHEGAL
jgi:hypothetical protein